VRSPNKAQAMKINEHISHKILQIQLIPDSKQWIWRSSLAIHMCLPVLTRVGAAKIGN